MSGAPKDITKAEANLTAPLNGFVGSAGDTPEITITVTIKRLLHPPEESKNQIVAPRRVLNGSARGFNKMLGQMAYSFFASLFEVDEAECNRISQGIAVKGLRLGGGA